MFVHDMQVTGFKCICRFMHSYIQKHFTFIFQKNLYVTRIKGDDSVHHVGPSEIQGSPAFGDSPDAWQSSSQYRIGAKDVEKKITWLPALQNKQ